MDDKKIIINASPEKSKVKVLKSLRQIVKFSNNINDYDLFSVVDTYTPKQNDLFFSIIANVYEQHSNTIVFTSEKMRKIMAYERHESPKQFGEFLDKSFMKFMAIQEKTLSIDEKTGDKILTRRHLFQVVEINLNTLECKVQVDPEFINLFNNLENWTRFSLLQYTRLRSMYSKRLYRYLKQYRTIGKRSFTVDEFKEKLHISKSYKPGNIDQRILIPAIEELAAIFFNLKVDKIYAKGKKGRKLASYLFTWRKEQKNRKDINVNKILDKSIAIYYIRQNQYLSAEQKFEAIDRYKGLRAGTTAKIYQHDHPQTFFIEKAKKNGSRGLFVREDLNVVDNYSLSDLKSVVLIYERMNKEALLLRDDMSDLVELEIKLIKRQLANWIAHMQKDPNFEKSLNVPKEDTIVNRLFNHKLFDIFQVSNTDFKLDNAEIDRIRFNVGMQVRDEFAQFKNLKNKIIVDDFDNFFQDDDLPDINYDLPGTNYDLLDGN